MRLFELDYNVMVDRLRSVYTLAQRAEIEGERSGAELAFKRLLASIARDYGQEKADEAERLVKSPGRQEPPRARPRQAYRGPPKQEPPRQEPPRRRQKTPGSAYEHNGWIFEILRFTDPNVGKRGSDKVWGFAVKDRRYMTFWGKFGKTVSTKETDRAEAIKKYREKIRKGYNAMDANPIDYGYIFTQSKTW